MGKPRICCKNSDYFNPGNINYMCVPRDLVINFPKLGGLKQQVYSHNSEGQRSEIQVWAGPMFCEGSREEFFQLLCVPSLVAA